MAVGNAAAAVTWWQSYMPGGSNPWYKAWLPGGGYVSLPRGGSVSLPAGATAPSTPSTPSSLGGQTFSGTYTGAAGSLDYSGYVPSSYQAGTAVPLVVSLHGCTQSAADFDKLTAWDHLAEAKGFIVVFPQQSSSNSQYKCWNFFQSADMKRDSGEPALIAGITQWVQQHYSVDPHRTYVDGLSAGGAMSSVMAATYPDLYAAAGIGSGCEYAAGAACAGYKGIDPNQAGQQAYAAMGSHARPMPVVVFHGDQDQIVPPENAKQVVQQWQVTNSMASGGGAASASIGTSFPAKVTREQVPNGHTYSVSTYQDGNRAEMIQSWLVNGMGHAWSGGCGCAQYSDPGGPDETAAMYAFFSNHPMP